MGCTPREALFVAHYLMHGLNGTTAYMEAGFRARTPNVAAVEASRLLRKPKVRAYLAVRAKAMFDRISEEQDRVLQVLTFVAFADPNELVSYHRGACRYCWGQKNRYQFTAGEWDRKLEAHEAKREKALANDRPDPGALDVLGGTGYDKRKDPHPDCPECFGEGVGWQVIKDTRHLSPAALALYAGVKDSKEGLQVLMHSQEKARDMLAKIRRMFDESTNITLTFDGDALGARYAEKMARARERSASLRRERFGEELV